MRLQLNLAFKLTLVFVAFAASLLLSVGVLSYLNGREALTNATFATLISVRTEKEAAFDAWVNEGLLEIATLAASPTVRDVAADLVAAPSNSSVAHTAHDHLVAELIPWTGLGHRYLTLFFIQAGQAQVMAATEPSAEGNSASEQLYFTNGTFGPYIQAPYYDSQAQTTVMMIAAPLRAVDGRLLGVLAGRINIAQMETIITRRTGEFETDDAFLVNSTRQMITQPRLLTNPADLQKPMSTESVNRCLTQDTGTVLANDYRGVPTIVAYRWMPARDLCLIVKLDQAEAFAPANALMGTMVLISVVALVLASVIAGGLAQTITRPVRRLQAGAARFGQGELNVRLPITSRDELGALASEFNAMATSLSLKETQLRAYATELEQRVAERTAALQASEAELRALFAAMTDTILVLDAQGRCLKIAPTNPPPLQKRPASLIGKTLAEVYPPDQAAELFARIQQALETRQPVNVEYAVLLANQTFWFASIVAPMLADQVIWVSRDITDRKRAEEELAQRAADLARSNAELEQFAYVASHDLQEPLRMVSSYVQLLQRRYSGKLDADADEFIGYAVDGAMRMQRLINDLLLFSRVGTRGKPFTPIACDAALDAALTNLQIALEESHAVITREPLPTLLADEGQIVQLLQNLIGNAIKFHGAAVPQVHIAATRTDALWTFAVRDNGIGIDPQFGERIFILFQRLHSRSEYPGTGIGLAICKKIVERHGGRIWVESALNQGTTFYFTLPAMRN